MLIHAPHPSPGPASQSEGWIDSQPLGEAFEPFPGIWVTVGLPRSVGTEDNKRPGARAALGGKGPLPPHQVSSCT